MLATSESHQALVLALISFFSLFGISLWSILWLVRQQQQQQDEANSSKRMMGDGLSSGKRNKNRSSKSVKIERRRQEQQARHRQQVLQHSSVAKKRNSMYDTVTALFQQRNSNQHPTFATMHLQTMAHFTHCQRPTTPPSTKTEKAWYWNVDDEYVVRYSPLWSNDSRALHEGENSSKNGPCCWVLEPAYYDQQQVNNGSSEADDSKKNNNIWLTGRCRYDEMEFYAMVEIHFKNFFKNTTATYTKCDKPTRRPQVTSNSGSQYWESEDGNGVIRCSDHWSNTCGKIATCWWTYEPDKDTRHSRPYSYGEVDDNRLWLTGYCPYELFSIKSERRTLGRYAKQFLSRNPKDRKRLRYSQARSGVILDQFNRKLVNYRRLPKIVFQPKKKRAQNDNIGLQEDADDNDEGLLLGTIKMILLAITNVWISPTNGHASDSASLDQM